MMFCRVAVLLGLICVFNRAGQASQTYVQTSERDLFLKDLGEMTVSNARGDITVRGWALDKIRVKVTKRVLAANAGEAKKRFSWVEYDTKDSSERVEIYSGYGKNMSIRERIEEKENPKAFVDFDISAPAHLTLHLWGVSGMTQLTNWSARATVRSHRGEIRIQGGKGGDLAIVCPSCPIRISQNKGSLSCKGGEGNIDLQDVEGEKLYVETRSGAVKLLHIQGDQTYVSDTALVEGLFLTGSMNLKAERGRVRLREINGAVNAYMDEGELRLSLRKWPSAGLSLIESHKADLVVRLPEESEGAFEACAEKGQLKSDFPVVQLPKGGCFSGKVSSRSPFLKLTSQEGNLFLLKKDI